MKLKDLLSELPYNAASMWKIILYLIYNIA